MVVFFVHFRLNRIKDSQQRRCMVVLEGDIRSLDLATKRACADTEDADRMRLLFAPVDIMVSELLGGLGDNELSPECLYAAQAVALREGGISIPTRWAALCVVCVVFIPH